jgi:16S rRNA (guanine(966)-N(2))-methyltransferase RsmD
VRPARPSRRSASRPASQFVRIVGGLWKRSKLPVADKPGLRPTPQRVRETLFNWLGQDLTGWRCLDAFSGSGALGFEAASRGAAEVVLLERDADLVASLGASQARMKAVALRIECVDALAWMHRAMPARFDLVLLDLPFGDQSHAPALAAAAPLVGPAGLIYLEAPQALESVPDAFTLWRQDRAGAVHYHLLRRNS